MNKSGDLCSLPVFACCTSNFSCFLVVIPCCFLFRGKMFLFFSFLEHLITNLRHRFSLLFSKDSISRSTRAFKIILRADFWTLSKSDLLSSERELCHTTADCSSWLITKRKYICFRSSTLASKLATLLRSYMRAFAFLTLCAVFSSHLRSFVTRVPSNLARPYQYNKQ